ncbi:MAG: D-aminoacyl-tRNA deacylase [Candidatus Anstonellaceae archaeon]
MKPVVIVSADNSASLNIRDALLSLEDFEQKEKWFWSGQFLDIAQYSGSIVEIIPSHPAPYYIYASTHKSSSGKKCLTVHTPGNWGSAELGGRPETLNISLPLQLKAAALEMERLSSSMLGWSVFAEVDHHGPTIDAPLMFVEIGSSQEAWEDKIAGKVVAEAIIAASKNRREWPVYIGFGGTHYTPKFTPKILKEELALGHIISGYALENFGLDENRVRQAVEKNAHKIQGALIDWKGIDSKTRHLLINTLEQIGVSWERC